MYMPKWARREEVAKSRVSRLWDDEARRVLKAKPQKWLVYYIGNSYHRASEIGLKHQTRQTVDLLKVDLWNEAIEYERDILGRYQNRDNFHLYGIDISATVCSLAKNRLANVHIAQCDVRRLPFRDNCFSIVLDLSTLDHVAEHEVSNVIQEYRRVLKKEGVLVLIFWNNNPWVRLRLKLLKIIIPRSIQYAFPITLVKGILERNFATLEEYRIGTLLPLKIRILDPLLNRLPRAIYSLVLNIEYSRISRRLLRGFAGLHLIIARSK